MDWRALETGNLTLTEKLCRTMQKPPDEWQCPTFLQRKWSQVILCDPCSVWRMAYSPCHECFHGTSLKVDGTRVGAWAGSSPTWRFPARTLQQAKPLFGKWYEKEEGRYDRWRSMFEVKSFADSSSHPY